MGAVNHSFESGVTALTETTGAQITYENGAGCRLVSGTTYYFECSSKDANLQSIGLHWDATFAGTLTVEDCNFANVTGYEASAVANWIVENPSTAIVGFVGTVVWTALTGVVTTGAVGGSMIHVGNEGARRLRLKVVVTTTGYLRVATHGKD